MHSKDTSYAQEKTGTRLLKVVANKCYNQPAPKLQTCMKLSTSFEFSLFSFFLTLFWIYINIPHCSTSLSATICRTAEQIFFFTETQNRATNLLSSLRANKRASLMGKLLIVCVDRLCLWFSKKRIGNLIDRKSVV